MALNNIVRDWTIMADGNLLRGDVDDCNLPAISKKMEEYRGGGMDRPVEIDLGYEKMEFDFELTTVNPNILSLIGRPGSTVQFKVYGYTVGFDASQSGFTDTMQGQVKKIDQIALKPGDKTKIKVSVAVNVYARTVNGSEIFYSDPLNLVLRVNGIDVYAIRRQLLGF